MRPTTTPTLAAVACLVLSRGVTAAERVFDVDTTVRRAIGAIQAREGGPVPIPPIAKAAPYVVEGKAIPYQGYYGGRLRLVASYGPLVGLTKSLEAWQLADWGQGGGCRFRGRVDIAIRGPWFPFKRFIERRIEARILCEEEALIRELVADGPVIVVAIPKPPSIVSSAVAVVVAARDLITAVKRELDAQIPDNTSPEDCQ